MSKQIDVRHIQRTIEFCREKQREYAEMSASFSRQGLDHLAGWYEGRGGAFESTADWLETDIACFAEEAAQ